MTGIVTIDSNLLRPVYYLDKNGDGSIDYHLALGPWWYTPDSGTAWPSDGENVTVYGALQDHVTPPTVMVYELNGLTWRTAVEYGPHGWQGGPFWNNQGDTLTVTGTVLADTTYFYHHYYLDTDGDTAPEYRLDLGPIWYEPADGVIRPKAGEVITVFGPTHNTMGYDRLTVYTLNGLEWRSPDGPASWAGTWMYMNHPDTAWVYCVNDSTNRIGFPPGHMGQGMGSMQWPDSMFVQFWQIHPDSLPGLHENQRFVGFFLDMYDPQGSNMMNGSYGGRRGMMRFQDNHQFQFHYTDEILPAHGTSENEIMVQYWDDETQLWINHSDAIVDQEHNTISFASAEVSNYYALTTQSLVTGVEGRESPSHFVFHPNYPNPFNLSTQIRFDLRETGPVAIWIYNVLGEEVANLLDETVAAGSHEVRWSADALPSGVYLVRVNTGDLIQTQTATLIK